MDPNWIKIYSTSQSYKIELIKGLLKDNNIQAISINKKDSAYLFGEIELYVPVDSAFAARQILSKYNNEL
ncbi:MAG: DUF2007 domain-containing protein [Bacteroidales bacterium]|nr:DUF2007 domain-containing protein [Bacteroidales bacterium]